MEKQSIDYKEQIAQIAQRIKQQGKNAATIEFELQSNSIGSDIWRREIVRTSDLKNLENLINNTITKMNPDAIRIITWIDNKKEPVYDLKITDTYIPVVDEALRRGDQVYSGGNSDLRTVMQEFSSQLQHTFQGALSGVTSQLGEARINEIRTDSQNEILKMRHDNEIDKLTEKLRVLQEKLTETERYLKEEEKENDQFRQEATTKGGGTAELLQTGAVMFAGLMGKPELSQALAGMFGNSNAQLPVGPGNTDESSPRVSSEMEIQAYIQTMEPDDFNNFEMLVLYLKQYPNAIEVILKQLMAIEATAKTQNVG